MDHAALPPAAACHIKLIFDMTHMLRGHSLHDQTWRANSLVAIQVKKR